MRAPFLPRFARDDRGVAAVEMSLITGILITALLNVAEVSRYAYVTAQVGAASQAGAQAAVSKCTAVETPVTTNCAALNAEVTKAIRGTVLADKVKLHEALDEDWYCITADRKLQYMGDIVDRPADCQGAGDASSQPALYVKVQTESAFSPIFPGLTLASTFPSTIVKTAWMRVR